MLILQSHYSFFRPLEGVDKCDEVLLQWWLAIELWEQKRIREIAPFLAEVVSFDENSRRTACSFRDFQYATFELLSEEESLATRLKLCEVCAHLNIEMPKRRSVRDIVSMIVRMGKAELL
eukprot:m.224244 g.224244  ORF g.224244 m.224244 type:complete len:120 (+) comp15948_c0_seq10:26-385(+)